MSNNYSKFQIFQSPVNQQYYYRLRSANNEIILSGEGYTTRQACVNGINSVKANAPFDSRYQKKISNNSQYFFTLHAGNGEAIGVSEMYTSSSGRDNGIEAVKRDAPGAPIE